MIYRLPTRQDLAHYTLQLTLDNIEWFVSFDWNQQARAWYFSIFDSSNTILLAGRKILIERSLLLQYRNPLLPPGDLVAYDTSSQHMEAKIDDLGTRVILCYLDLAEFSSLYT